MIINLFKRLIFIPSVRKMSFFFPYRIICLFGLLLVFGLESYAQNKISTENWNPGYIVTTEEDSIYGPVLINFPNDLVQVNEENTVKTFAANQLKMIYFKSNEGEEERFYYPFKFHPYSDFKPFKIFEMLFSGVHLSLLAREMLITETVPYFDSFTYRTFYSTQTRLVQEFYFLFPGEKVKSFSGSKKELLSLLADKKEELKKFISDSKISLNQKDDLVKLVKEYNKLKIK